MIERLANDKVHQGVLGTVGFDDFGEPTRVPRLFRIGKGGYKGLP